MTSSTRSRRTLVPFIERACNLRLRPFQTDFLTELAREENGRRVHTAALWGLPRGNGKTEVAAAVALQQLIGDGRRFAEVIIAAGSRDQAAIAFQSARRMIENGPLSEHVHVLPGRKVIVHEASDSSLRIVSREGPLQHGLRPTAVIFDELWNQPDRELWDALVGGLIKVPEPMLLCISTAGYDQGSLLAELCERGEKGDDPRFLYRWHGLPEGFAGDYRDPETWKLANPAMACDDPFLSVDGVMDSLSRMHEAEFRRWHLNQWTLTETQWISMSAWEACHADKPVEGSVVLGFSGTYSNDSAALVGVADSGHVFVVDAWESNDELGIDRARVAAALKEAIAKYRPRRIVVNPHGWISEVQEWGETYGSALVSFDWAHQTKRKADACSRFYSAVINRKLTHDGDPRLASHLSAAVVKETPEGAYITKGGRESPRKVELAVAAVMAFDQVQPEVEVMIDWDD